MREGGKNVLVPVSAGVSSAAAPTAVRTGEKPDAELVSTSFGLAATRDSIWSGGPGLTRTACGLARVAVYRSNPGSWCANRPWSGSRMFSTSRE
eukprot:scaffold12246_cov112-Isochrysis_galbana.AAC.3